MPEAPSPVPQVPPRRKEPTTQQRPTRPPPSTQAAKPPSGQFKERISSPTPPPSNHIKTRETRAPPHSGQSVSSGRFSLFTSPHITGVRPLGPETPLVALISSPPPVIHPLSISTFSASSPTKRDSGASIPSLHLSPISAASSPVGSPSRFHPEATWLPYPFPRGSDPRTPTHGTSKNAPVSSPISPSSSLLSFNISGSLFPSPTADHFPPSTTSGTREVGCSAQILQRKNTQSPRVGTDVPPTPGKDIEALLRQRAATKQPPSPGQGPFTDQFTWSPLPPSGDAEGCSAPPPTPGKFIKRRLSWENSSK